MSTYAIAVFLVTYCPRMSCTAPARKHTVWWWMQQAVEVIIQAVWYHAGIVTTRGGAVTFPVSVGTQFGGDSHIESPAVAQPQQSLPLQQQCLQQPSQVLPLQQGIQQVHDRTYWQSSRTLRQSCSCTRCVTVIYNVCLPLHYK